MGVRQKGSTFERKVASMFSERFNIPFRRTPLSGGFDKRYVQGDIFTNNKKFSIVVECKNHKTFSVPQWWKQVIADTPRFKVPVLVINFSGTYHKNKKYPFNARNTGVYAILRQKDYEKYCKPVETITAYLDESQIQMLKYISEVEKNSFEAVRIRTDILTGTKETYILLTLAKLLEHFHTERCFKRLIAVTPKKST